jgi:Tol biopolymer transport system component
MKLSLLNSLVFAAATIGLTACDLNSNIDDTQVDTEGLYDFYLYDVSLNKNTLINPSPTTVEISYSISPDSKKIMFVDSKGINLMAIDGTNDTLLVANGVSPCFSPDGSKIAYILGDHLYTANINGSNKTKITTSDINIEYPLWSNDGQYIACNSINGLCLIALDGTTKIVSTTNSIDWYNWSANSNELYYCKYDANRYSQVFKYNIGSSTETKLTDISKYNYSPKSNYIDNSVLFTSSVSSYGSDLITMLPDGTDKKVILHKNYINTPNWSPTGNQIAFITESSNVAIVDKSGLNYKVINEKLNYCMNPLWSNDGKYILYYRAVFYN